MTTLRGINTHNILTGLLSDESLAARLGVPYILLGRVCEKMNHDVICDYHGHPRRFFWLPFLRQHLVESHLQLTRDSVISIHRRATLGCVTLKGTSDKASRVALKFPVGGVAMKGDAVMATFPVDGVLVPYFGNIICFLRVTSVTPERAESAVGPAAMLDHSIPGAVSGRRSTVGEDLHLALVRWRKWEKRGVRCKDAAATHMQPTCGNVLNIFTSKSDYYTLDCVLAISRLEARCAFCPLATATVDGDRVILLPLSL